MFLPFSQFIFYYSSTFIITVSLGFSIVKRAGVDQALFPILSIPPDAGTLKKKYIRNEKNAINRRALLNIKR